MKKAIRILCLALALILVAGSTFACTITSENDGNKEIVNNDTGTSEDKKAEDAGAPSEEDTSADNTEPTDTENNASGNTEKLDITIEEQVLLEKDGIKITAKEYVTDPIWGDGITVLVENSGTVSTTVTVDNLIINNYMISNLFSCTVAAGKKATETISFVSTDLEAADIINVGLVEIYFSAYDSDTFDTFFKSDACVIKTSAFDTVGATADTSGTELYNKDGIRIIGKSVNEDGFLGAEILLYIENNSGKNVTVSCDDLSVNGYMMTSLFASTVYNNKMAFDGITVLSSDLEENGIESIEEVELTFRLYDPDTYETISETEPISFSVKEN